MKNLYLNSKSFSKQFSINFMLLIKSKMVLLTVFILTGTFLLAQDNDDYWRRLEVDLQNFTAITDSFNIYISTQYPDSIPQEKLKNIKDYYRFVDFWKSRVGLINDTTISYIPYFKSGINNLNNPYCEASDPADWELLGPSSLSNQNLGLVTEVLSDPSTPGSYLLSSDRGGIWKNQTTGNSWVNVTDYLKLPGMTATEMIRNPFDNDHIIASTGGGMHTAHYGLGIIESFDNGNTWSLQEEDFPYNTCPFVQKVIYDPNDNNPTDGLTLWAITQTTNSGKIYYSTNTGENWVEVTGPPTMPNFARFHDIEIDDQGTVWVTTSSKYNNQDGGVYKLNNGIWFDISNVFQNGIKYQQAALTKPYGGKVFVKVDNCNLTPQSKLTRVYKTTNYGATWTFLIDVFNKVSNKNQCEIEYSPASEIIYFGGIHVGLLKDDGLIDTIVFNPLHHDVRDFDFIGIDANNYENVLVATDGGITLLKVNIANFADRTLENLNGNHLPIGNFLGIGVSHSDNEFIVGGAIHCHSFKYNNGVWTNFSGGDGGDSEVNWNNQDIYYYQNNAGMYTSSKSAAIYNVNNWFIGMEYELNPNNPYIVYFGREKKGSNPAYFMIYNETTDNLNTRNAPTAVEAVGPIGINQSNILFFADYHFANESTPNRFNKSVDDGQNWDDMSFKPVYEYVNGNWIETNTLIKVLAWRTIEDIVFNPDDPNEMWISIGGVYYESEEPVGGKLRVLHSTDLGESWYDYSENLSPFPVMALEYQKGSNKRLFAGTDAGVYYRDANMSQWECFNDGLPNCIITDLDYDPCNKVMYASTQGRAIYKTDVPFIDTTFTYLDSNLIIPSNTTLVISSAYYISKDAKIIVMPGGKLVIDGGLLTNLCGDLWQGIEVWGNPNATQIPQNQGIVQVINGGTIENAEVAIRVGSEDYTGKGGGMVFATNANFKNNPVGVWFDPYSYTMDNLSYFRYCTFDYDRTVTGEVDLTFARLNDVHQVEFKGSEFTNNSNQDHLGIGIESFNSIFTLDGMCNDYSGDDCIGWDYGSFTNLQYGVYAIASNSTDYADIRHTNFNSNYRGIYLAGMTLPRVTSNNFILNDDAANESYGLYLDGCTQYWVEDNAFEGEGLTTEKGIGIVVNESGKDVNLIYDNAFNYVEYAINVQGANRNDRLTTEGLEIRCNHFDNTLFDISVIFDGMFIPSGHGIASQQGRNTTLAEDMAGNIFYYNTSVSGDFDDLNNESNFFDYYYSTNAGYFDVEPMDATWNKVSKHDKYTLTEWSFEQDCPSTINTGGGSIEENIGRMNDAQSDIETTRAILTALVDGGDTDALNNEVKTSTPPEAIQVYNELISKSPNLSETVVESAIEKEDILPNAMLRDVMVANPHTAKSLILLQKLDERYDPIPEYMKAQILAGRSVHSLKQELEAQLAGYMLEKALAMNTIIRYYHEQLEPQSASDSILAFYQADNTLYSSYSLAWQHFKKGEYQNGEIVMNNIPGQFALNDAEQLQYSHLSAVYDMLSGLYKNGLTISSLTSGQLSDLQFLASAGCSPAVTYARNILLALGEMEYSEPVLFPDNLKSSKAMVEFEKLLHTKSPQMLEVYPNPAKGYVIIGFNLESEAVCSVVIRDVSGKTMHSVTTTMKQDQLAVITENWQSGVYIASLYIDGVSVESSKFTLVK